MAIPVTQAVKNAMKAPVKQLRAKIEYYEEGDDPEPTTITSADALISLKKEAEGYYLSSTLRKLTIVIAGTATDLLDKRATVTIEVKTGTNTWGQIPWGSFWIREMTVNEEAGTTTFIGYGGIYRMQDTEYTAGALNFPSTPADLAAQIVAKFGMELDTDMTTLPNYDAPITEDLWAKITGTTYRDILEQIAGATGTLAVISGGNDTLNFIPVPISGTTEALTTANLKKLKIGNSWGVANAVVLSRQPQNDNIELADQESIEETGQRTDVVIANNEILDPQRTTTIEPLLEAVTGWTYRDGQITTEGHGWHEVGDTLSVTVAGETYRMIVTKSAITVNGGISEILTSTTPEPTTINYAQAGGITKTIYNTEITVDKQGQEIIAIVSRQDATDATVASHYSEIKQDLQNITATVQTVGGGNLIQNSAGYGVESDGKLSHWTYGTGATTDTVSSESSPSSLTAGATSGNQINITGATISQRVAVTPGIAHTISARIHQYTVGSGQIRVHNQLDDFSITIADQEEYIWKEKVLTFTPTQGYIDVELTSAANTTTAITDLMLAQGDARQSWKQAAGEIYNTQVSIDAGGVQVRSSAYQGDYVQITPLEFAGYSNASGAVRKVFSLNRDTTEVEKLHARSEIQMEPIKIVPMTSGSYRGWAFVKI